MVTRDTRGRFIKGVSGNPGGRRKGIQDLIDSAVTEDDLKTILVRLVGMAKHGNIKAAEFLFDRLYGKPMQKTELTGKDGGAIPIEMFEHAVKQVYGSD